ncbi:DUF2061 domain-containing protein [Flagellimonas allohymeniacidonis]|uniref:DUF2061 domain-containing protein n=1 Tax=Flagellimonas allohymeniacidonis TaxID=2517819 RepID=A0A4Q8QDR9_9FLAO|nr:DUF2061 domain-containing protein [Allomuricauda hymeniacidonis]TAI48555.1 DUF2061 domain-containing protein [Allomuricauda hymeniacidonis]
MEAVSYKRHLAKTITWRVIGTLDTIVLSWLITGNPLMGFQIGTSELITKMVLYYVHERVWLHVQVVNSKRRHLLKTITWRCIGTLDTVVISWIISGDPFIGFKIGAVEIITKMALYYLHERAWYRINFGLDRRQRAKKWKRT